MHIKTTHTHAILVLSGFAWDDIYERLNRAGVLKDYLEDKDKIIFGDIALVREIAGYNGPG